MGDGEDAAADEAGTEQEHPEAEATLEAAPSPERIGPHDLGIELPEDPDEAVQLLLAEVASARTEAAAYLDDLRRVAADFDNYRKRTQREAASNIDRASQRVVAGLLPVLDSLELAVAHQAQTESEEKLLGGVRTTYQQLLDSLAKEGLEHVEALGVDFDPEVHEAVGSTATGEGSLVVTTEMRRGYRLRGRLIRPAMVVVGDHE